MPRTITATTAARTFRAVLNAVEHEGATFRIERHGRLVAEIGPTAGGASGSRWGEVQAALRTGPQPDDAFEAGLVALRQSVGHLPADPWARSSTPRS